MAQDTTQDQAPARPATAAENKKATSVAIDAAAGAPAGMRAAAEALPEKDDVQKAHKEALLAEDAQTEAQAHAEIVKLSPDADETPSGVALLKTAGIGDDVKRGEEYTRIKSGVRFGTMTPEDAK